MKTNVSEHDFSEAFRTMGRGSSFTYAGLRALYEYFTGLEEDAGEEIDLDVIAIDCDFCQLEIGDMQREYGNDDTKEFDHIATWANYLNERTTALRVTDTDYTTSASFDDAPQTESLIIQSF